MSRKDFELIASIIRDLSVLPADVRALVAGKFATELSNTNARFDRARFLRACGVVS